jgi:hypothetical protein
MTHGPLPIGVNVTGQDNEPRYGISLGGKPKTFSKHPLSPGGRKEWGSVLDRAGEEKGTKASVHGASHPPIVYKPADWIWERGDGFPQVLISALRLSGVVVDLSDFQAQSNIAAVGQLMNGRDDLYHARDREVLAMFDDEHKASCWARFFGRGLVIVGPEIRKDRTNFSNFREPASKNRTAVRARWSSGDQEDLPPAFLGCLPANREFLSSPTTNTTAWFVMIPTEAKLKHFQDRFIGYVNLQRCSF